MKKYKVNYEFKIADVDICDGKWHKDCLDNNGAGYTFEEAENAACNLRANAIINTKWAEVVEMEG